jgi:hypothetical protein
MLSHNPFEKLSYRFSYYLLAVPQGAAEGNIGFAFSTELSLTGANSEKRII